MYLSLSRKLTLLAGFGMVTVVLVAGAALSGTARIGVGLRDVVDHGDALRSAVLIDMEHDGIRGDVFYALSSEDPALRDETLGGIADRVATMGELFGDVSRSLQLDGRTADGGLRRASEDVQPLLTTYWAAATDAAELGRRDPTAARAGEAGKGFAVVATEVKSLAGETRGATDNVNRTIGAIREGTAEATDSLERISSVIARINELQQAIAGAVSEQADATQQIERTADRVAQATTSITATIAGIVEGAEQTTAAAGTAEAATHELAHMAGNLNALAGRFEF